MIDWGSLFTQFLIAAFTSSLVYYFGIRQSALTYKNDYYKKIIENRVDAYKLVQDLLATLSPQKNDTGDGKEPDFLILFWVSLPYSIRQRNLDLDKQFKLEDYKGEVNHEIFYFELFRRDLAAALRQEAWLSGELIDALKGLFKHLALIYDAYTSSIGSKEYRPSELEEIGKEHHERLLTMRDNIKKIFYRDILSLHEVNNFIAAKKAEYK